MTLTSHTRIYDLQQAEKAPVAISWQDALLTVDNLSVIKGARNKAAAMKLVNFMNRPDLQAEFAQKDVDRPGQPEGPRPARPVVKDRSADLSPAKGEMAVVDSDWWAANLEKLEERWNTWKLK